MSTIYSYITLYIYSMSTIYSYIILYIYSMSTIYHVIYYIVLITSFQILFFHDLSMSKTANV